MGWSKERLEHVARTRLGGAKLIVVANREPYIHRYTDGESHTASGCKPSLKPGIWRRRRQHRHVSQ